MKCINYMPQITQQLCFLHCTAAPYGKGKIPASCILFTLVHILQLTTYYLCYGNLQESLIYSPVKTKSKTSALLPI